MDDHDYTVLVYVGLFGVTKGLKSVSLCEKFVFTSLAGLTVFCATWLLIQIQLDTGRYRTLLERIHDRWLSQDEKEVMQFRRYRKPALRGVWFLVALIGVAMIGAGIVIYSFWR